MTSRETAQTSWLHRMIMINRRTFPIEVTSPYAVKRMAEHLEKGGRLVLFPEGRLSHTPGNLMKLFDDPDSGFSRPAPKSLPRISVAPFVFRSRRTRAGDGSSPR